MLLTVGRFIIILYSVKGKWFFRHLSNEVPEQTCISVHSDQGFFCLSFTTLWANSTNDKLTIFF